MKEGPEYFYRVHEQVLNAYHRLAKNPISATTFKRSNCSDVFSILSGMKIFDITDEVNVEVQCKSDEVILIFSVKGDEE